MAKRPQKTAKYTGMPNISPNVVANPLDTAVVAGKEGMPAAPGGLARPAAGPDIAAPVNNQAAIDGRRTAAAFSGLSQSLKGAAFAREEYLDMLDTEGSQLSAYIDFSNNEKLVFTKALSNGQIQAMDHPRFQAALAEGAARQRAGLIKSIYKEDSAKLRAGDEAYNIDAYDAALTGIYEAETKSYKGPREDVYRAELQAAFNSQKDFLISGERKWISENSLVDAEKDLRSTVTSALENVQTLERDTIVVQQSLNPDSDMAKFLPDGYRKTVDVIGETDAKYYDRQVQTAADQLTATLDGRRGDLLSSENMNLIIGKHLIDLAANNSKMSRFAEDVLKKTTTGPEDNRAPLLAGQLKDEYLMAEDKIQARQSGQRSAVANRQFRAGVTSYRETLVNEMIGVVEQNPEITVESLLGGLTKRILGDQRSATTDDGVTITIQGDSLNFTAPEGSGITVSDSISLSGMKTDIAESLIRRRADVEEESGLVTRVEALAIAAGQYGISSEELNAEFSSVRRGANLFNMQLTDDTRSPEEREAQIFKAESALRAYTILKKNNSERTLPKQDQEFFESLNLIRTDPTLRAIAGNTMQSALSAMATKDTDSAEVSWENGGADSMSELAINLPAGQQKYVKDVAMLGLAIGSGDSGLTVEQSISNAINISLKRFSPMYSGGPTVDTSDINVPDLFKAAIESDTDPSFEDGDYRGLAVASNFIQELMVFTGIKEKATSVESHQKNFELMEQMLLSPVKVMKALTDAAFTDREAFNNIIAVATELRPQILKNIGPQKVTPSTEDVMLAANAEWTNNPPEWFSINYQTVSPYELTNLRFVPIEGSQGNFFFLEAQVGQTKATRRILNENSIDENGSPRPFSFIDVYTLYKDSLKVAESHKWEPSINEVTGLPNFEEMHK